MSENKNVDKNIDLVADGELIHWLMFVNNEPIKTISDRSEVSYSTVRDIKSKKTKIGGIRLKNASKLTAYAVKRKEELGTDRRK